ncbi:MAG: phosphopyruvate hydratase, partial [Nitrospiraceae bacterium]|nr:phosphopyruvate hydratase [Nitrospiraceae bacterium]
MAIDNQLLAIILTGIHEAVELRDGGKAYMGKGVMKAIDNIKEIIAPALIGKNPAKQKELDNLMISLDGTKNKSKLGANAILAVSMALARAGAKSQNLPLYKYIAKLYGFDFENQKLVIPTPSFNIINGGKHAGNPLDIQEYMIFPVGAVSFHEAMKMATETYHLLKNMIKSRYGIDATNVGDEGGFAPDLKDNEEPLKLITEAIKEAGYEGKIKIAIDSAASEFYDGEHYLIGGKIDKTKTKKYTYDEMNTMYKEFLSNYPLISLEDPFAEDDWDNFVKITQELGDRYQIVGDDILVTNPERIQKAIELKACNSLLLKLNQIGTVTESIEAAKLARSAGWSIMVSHRSGETEDPFIADFSVGICSGEIKSGAPCRSERLAKYNQLLRIEEELGDSCVFAGEKCRNPL